MSSLGCLEVPWSLHSQLSGQSRPVASVPVAAHRKGKKRNPASRVILCDSILALMAVTVTSGPTRTLQRGS